MISIVKAFVLYHCIGGAFVTARQVTIEAPDEVTVTAFANNKDTETAYDGYESVITTVDDSETVTITMTITAETPLVSAIDSKNYEAYEAALLEQADHCELPPSLHTPCVISSNTTCIDVYYQHLKACWDKGKFLSLKNVANYYTMCASELSDDSSLKHFKKCVLDVLKRELYVDVMGGNRIEMSDSDDADTESDDEDTDYEENV